MDQFSTNVLRRVVENLDQPLSFLLDKFFPLVQEDTEEEIHFDVDSSKQRITPFVHPLREGKVVENEGFVTKSFKPAYAKDKRRFNPSDPLKRSIGENIGGSLDPETRRRKQINRTISNQLKMLTRREEVMAAEVMRTGKVTVKGDGYPSVVVDFGRDAALTIALAGAAKWDQATSTPLDDLENVATLIQTKSGAVVKEFVMDGNAWKNFRKHADVKNLLETRRGSSSTAEVGPRLANKARFGGTIGDFDIWIYNDTFIDDDGNVQTLMPSGQVVASGPDLEGTRAYGAIQDEAAGYTATRYHIKSWIDNDPPIRWMMLQSAPLVVPYRVNACAGMTVL